MHRFDGAWMVALVALLPATLSAQVVARSLPPVEDFLKLDAYSSVQLSPDGRTLAAIIPINGHRNVALVDLEKHSAIALTGQDTDDVSSYRWLGDRVIEVTTADLEYTGGGRRLHQHILIDVVDKVVLRDLLAISRFGAADVLDAAPGDGSDLIIQTVDRSVYSADVYRYDARHGTKKLLTFHSPGNVHQFIADHDGQVRVAISSPRDGTRTIVSYRRSNDDEWTTLHDDPVGGETFEPVGFDFDDRTLYVRVPSADRAGLLDMYTYDVETGKVGARVFEASGVDARGILSDRVARKIVGFRDGSASGVHWVDPSWKQLQVAIDEVLPNAHNQLGWASNNTDRVLVTSETPVQPANFFVFDRKKLTLEKVASSRPWLKADDLSPRNVVHYQARDGLTIPGYLTMPRHPDGTKPPLIVNIHGGPYVRGSHFGYNGEAEFFASRGYAVLEPNFRGTQGYGQAFEKAGWRQWGLAMQDDITDGVKWLIDAGKVDGDRVCLYGASYGGYATLWGLEKEPSMFRCGVAFLAVSDLELLMDVTWSDTNRYGGESAENYYKRTVGDPSRDREKLRAVSPTRHADRIQAPLLLAYGGTDERVPIVHGLHMKDALDAAHKPYEWIAYSEQRHTFFDPVNRADFYARVEAFLAKNLAPRTTAQPVSVVPSGAVSLQ